MNKFLIILSFAAFLFSNYEYSSQDYNETSPTYREDVWTSTYSDHITLHYFSTQG